MAFIDILYDFYYQYAAVESYVSLADIHLDDAHTAWDIPDDHAAIGHLLSWADDIDTALGLWTDRYTPNYPRYHLVNLIQKLHDRLLLVEDGGEFELTLVKMIEAYIDAGDDARSAQRLLFDAYQASMYDKPFDKEYHALWVQRFKSWA